MSAEAAYEIPGQPPEGRLGGHLDLVRYIGGPFASLAIPAERWSEVRIAGTTVALATPILPDLGLGTSAVVAYDGEVVTVIRATGLELQELLKVAEAVLR